MLLLFDIDGTLIRAGGAGRRALTRAFFALHRIEDALSSVRLDGNTDPSIVREAFQTHLGRSPTASEIQAVVEAYLQLLEVELERGPYSVLPGVAELVSAASRDGAFALGLATGNVERGARIKLEKAALNRFFEFGGFGSDAEDRSVFVGHAIARGQARAEARFGRRFEVSEVAVIGDTERDVAAARAAGVLAIGVRAGSTRPDLLEAAAPDLLVDSLADSRLWSFLRLSPERDPDA